MNLLFRVRERFRRDLARWFGCRPARIEPAQPVISFTFDDFPRSSLLQAGALLCEQGIAATYYAAFGLMGKRGKTGEIFREIDAAEFRRQGHELGCHTFDHYDAWETAPVEFEASILRNQRAAAAWLTEAPLLTLSYPLRPPRPQTKRRAARYYAACRAGGQTFNLGPTDLNLLKAFFLEQQRDDITAIERLIEDTVRQRGWLIFATHDVCENPTRYGCTPAFFERLVRAARASGALLLPVGRALSVVQPAATPAGPVPEPRQVTAR